MTKSAKGVVVLTVICLVLALMLGGINTITEGAIRDAENAKVEEALKVVFPDGSFKNDDRKITLSDYENLPSTVTEAYREDNGLGFVIKLETKGYAAGFVIMCGVGTDGTVKGATYVASNETNGAERGYGDNFIGKDMSGVDEVDTIASSTKTTTAYKNAVKDAIGAALIFGGGDYDGRTEEEKISDALPTAEGEFTYVVLTERLENVRSVYRANNGAGYVFALEDGSYIGSDANGTPVGEDYASEFYGYFALHINSIENAALDNIDLSTFVGISSTVTSVKSAASGAYVVEVKAAGYGINGGNKYHPASGEYIIIRLSVDADGKIISCLTVSEEETDGFGSACAESWFYTQFENRTSQDYAEIDGISGATMTTNGYTAAIKDALDAVEIIKGGQ